MVVNSPQAVNKRPRVRHSELTTVSSSMVGHPDKDGQVHGPSLVLTAISESRIGEGLDVNPGTTMPCSSQRRLSLHSCWCAQASSLDCAVTELHHGTVRVHDTHAFSFTHGTEQHAIPRMWVFVYLRKIKIALVCQSNGCRVCLRQSICGSN